MNPPRTIRVFEPPTSGWPEATRHLAYRERSGGVARCVAHTVTAPNDRPSKSDAETFNEWLIEQGATVGETVWIMVER